MEITMQGKPLRELSTPSAHVLKAVDNRGQRLLVKLLNLRQAKQHGYEECLQFNVEVLEQMETFYFQENLLPITARVANQQFVGFVTEPYDCTLQTYLQQESIDEKEAMNVFDQVLRAIYALYTNGYWHRNPRPEHFVRCGTIWRLESLVLNHDYSSAAGINSAYLWSPRHQPPEFEPSKEYSEEQLNQFTVWALGSILLQLVVGSNRLSTRQTIDKFKDKPFSFEALGMKSQRINKLSTPFKKLLGSLLHHNPSQRITLIDLFRNSFASQAVALHAEQHQSAICTKIFKPNSHKKPAQTIVNSSTKAVMKVVSQMNSELAEEEKKVIREKINSVVDDETFLQGLENISKHLPQKSLQAIVGIGHPSVRRSLELYKSYYDQSELLLLAADTIDQLPFAELTAAEQVREIRALVKQAIALAAVMNLHALAEGFNQNRNFLKLQGEDFTLLQGTSQYAAFQRLANVKLAQHAQLLQKLTAQAQLAKGNLPATQDLHALLTCNYKTTTFAQIKVPYRYIVKMAYDCICDEFNEHRFEPVGAILAQRAMLVTYCLTVDKLYIREQIPTNFGYYFQWAEKTPSNYVGLNDFKEYILKAPREILVDHSRYILKRYYAV